MKLRKRTLFTIIIIMIIIVVIAISAAFITGLITIPRSTKLTVNPPTFVIESGGTIILSAKLESETFILSGKTIVWSASEGILDKNVGDVITYTAPLVTENKTVRITISFSGDREYYGSSTTIMGVVTPKKGILTTLSISPPTFELSAGSKIVLKRIQTLSLGVLRV
ncbi:MAG: hypothetical protein QXO01_03290 [Nitrososphaerota archaeon]